MEKKYLRMETGAMRDDLWNFFFRSGVSAQGLPAGPGLGVWERPLGEEPPDPQVVLPPEGLPGRNHDHPRRPAPLALPDGRGVGLGAPKAARGGLHHHHRLGPLPGLAEAARLVVVVLAQILTAMMVNAMNDE
eukprot:scaffold260678_cov23-Prasinocladus_malaysianus.AAC.1